MKLAITQIVLGVLVAAFSIIVISTGFPTQFTLPADESGIMVTVFVYPSLSFAQVGAFLAMFLGLAVVGCGIAQLVKARGAKRVSRRAKAPKRAKASK
jgi:hypothetical protein